MGRSKYTSAERAAIVSDFIEATRSIIDESGIESVSIRKVAAKVGCSSAMLYLYFTDLDDLLTTACVSYLESYCRELVEKNILREAPGNAYYDTWVIFCRKTFENPRVFDRLFFKGDTSKLDDTVKRYYMAFPKQLENLTGAILNMALAGDLYKRNMSLLEPYAHQLGYSVETTDLINKITISYFHACLDKAKSMEASDENIAALTDDFMKAARFITEPRS
ncbi:MAG: TetR family transcriptional regulator [Atopobiaceae bacterium]